MPQYLYRLFGKTRKILRTNWPNIIKTINDCISRSKE
uniref:Uncharacterized protein n=1 Tax=Rhizophora mucronata TaxID=61149 RepID=A0A2P2PCD7_RHIMU